MRRQYLRILLALVGFASFGATAKAQFPDQLTLTIPFEFVAAGKTLPAGTYRVNRVSGDNQEALVLSSFENGAGAIVSSTEVENSSADKAHVTFEKVGGQHFLSKIETAGHLFTIPISSSATMQAAAKSPSGTSASGSSGTN